MAQKDFFIKEDLFSHLCGASSDFKTAHQVIKNDQDTIGNSQSAEYGRFRRDLGCGKAVKSRGRGAKMIWGRLGGGQGAVVPRNYKQMAISL